MSEASLQKQIADTFYKILPGVFWSSIEVSNGRGKDGRNAQKNLRIRGVKTGFPDMLLMWHVEGELKALFIELKYKSNGLTKSQIQCHAEIVEKLNAPVVVCRTLEEVLHALHVYDVPTLITHHCK